VPFSRSSLKTACDVAERIGVFAADLFSKDDDAKRFYLKYGFIPLQDDPFHLYGARQNRLANLEAAQILR
jgi:hypothetical protein